VFMSTHILADVERVCDAVGIIARGKLIVEAPQKELVEQYAVPAFEIECDSGDASQLHAWTDALRVLPWVASVSTDASTARVVVSDVHTAKRELLASAAQAGLLLTRYQMVKPSLEDVFLRLVDEGGGA